MAARISRSGALRHLPEETAEQRYGIFLLHGGATVFFCRSGRKKRPYGKRAVMARNVAKAKMYGLRAHKNRAKGRENCP